MAEAVAERDEAQRELTALQELPDIDFDVIPVINLNMREIPGDYDEASTYAYDSEAFLRVRNAAEGGGEKATARGVTPEIEVAGARHVGWDIGASRDFPPTRVEHIVYVAFKRQDQAFATATLVRPEDRQSGPIWGPSSFAVRLTLRGENFPPRSYAFRLRNEGEGGKLVWAT